MSAVQFWAERGAIKMGPFATREEALAAFRAAHPFKGPAHAARANKNRILTGFGAFGAYSDLRWHDATAT